MYDETIPPILELQSTISHPDDPVKVIGFNGRDVRYGRDAVVMKLEEVPMSEVGTDAEPAWGFVESVANKVKLGSSLYLVGDDEVYALGSDEHQLMEGVFFENKDGESRQMHAHVERTFTQYDRDEVETRLK